MGWLGLRKSSPDDDRHERRQRERLLSQELQVQRLERIMLLALRQLDDQDRPDARR